MESLPDGAFLVRAAMGVGPFNKLFGVEIPEGPYETLGGYLNAIAGSIPEDGSKFFFAGLQFTVVDRTPQRIRRVRVDRVKRAEAPRPPSGEVPTARGWRRGARRRVPNASAPNPTSAVRIFFWALAVIRRWMCWMLLG